MAGPLTVGSAVLKVLADTKGANKALKDFQQNTEAGFQKIRKTAGIAMTAAGTAIVGAFGLAAKKAASFGDGVANLATLGVKDMDKMKEGVFELGRTFGIDLKEGTDAAYQTISAGIPEDAAIMVLEQAARGAQAGVSTLGEALDLGTSVMNAYGLTTDDAVETTDNFERVMGLAATAVKDGKTTIADMSGSIGQLGPVASNAGVSVEEMFSALSALTGTGLSASEAITQLRSLILEMGTPTEQQAKRFGKLGIEVGGAAMEVNGFTGMLDILRQQTGGNVEVMRSLFGSVEAFNGALSLTGSQAAGFAKTLANTANATANLTEMSNAFAEGNYGLAFRKLQVELAILAVQVGEAVLPAFKQMLDIVKPIISAITEWMSRNTELASTIATVVLAAGALMAILGPILLMLPGLAVAFAAVTAGVGAITAPIWAVGAAFVALGAIIVATVMPMWDQFRGWLDNNWKQITRIFWTGVEIVGHTLGIFGNIIKSVFFVISAIFAGFVRGVTGAWAGADDATKKGTESFLDKIERWANNTEKVYKWISEKLTAFSNWLWEYWPAVVDGVRWFADEVWSPIAWLVEQVAWGVGKLRDALVFLNQFNLAWQGVKGVAGMAAPGMATGGMIERGGLVNVHKDELVMLPTGAEVIPKQHTQAVANAVGGGGGQSVNVTINNPVVLDDSGLRKLRDELGRVTGRSITQAMSARGLA